MTCSLAKLNFLTSTRFLIGKRLWTHTSLHKPSLLPHVLNNVKALVTLPHDSFAPVTLFGHQLALAYG